MTRDLSHEEERNSERRKEPSEGGGIDGPGMKSEEGGNEEGAAKVNAAGKDGITGTITALMQTRRLIGPFSARTIPDLTGGGNSGGRLFKRNPVAHFKLRWSDYVIGETIFGETSRAVGDGDEA